jgi:predicted O-methyltransferase YrrM
MAKIKNTLPITINWEGVHKREVYLDSQVKKYKWTIGVEVGVRFGQTLFYLLDNNPKLKMYAVDIDISQFFNNDVAKQYGDRLVVLSGDSSAQAENILEKVDFVFIDAGHSKKSVLKDIEAYRKIVKTTQGVLGHDIDYPSIQEALKISNIEYDVCPDNVWQQKN